ncbi:hypothetical protein GCK72_025510 [Caenorhabditis remanei]|uniref:Uncharacterized protein n=1 Tax=Caenorhabditis remanei TaxID=31234 RepID=A0A6A5G2L4_CAERE|nr:hypothetical protein GCK72_025510 [Caenorhabditis remanei]KAF1749043.1 hypothetical protein GCK72_025510 [Caenorhabditis remanei]
MDENNIPQSFSIIMQRDQPISVEAQNSLCDEVRENHALFGRNFLNMFRQKLEDEDLEVSNETFLVEPDLERLIERFRRIIQNRSASTTVYHFKWYFIRAKVICERKKEQILKYKKTEDKKDWVKWHRDLMDQCRSLKQKFPYHFGILLSSFLNPLDRPLMDGKFRVRILKRGEDAKELEVEDWAVVEQRLEDYKNNKYIGYMLGIFDYWLQEAEAGLIHFLEEFPLLRVEQPKNQMKNLTTSAIPSSPPPSCLWHLQRLDNHIRPLPFENVYDDEMRTRLDFVDLGPNIRRPEKKTKLEKTSIPSDRSLGAFPTRCKGFAERKLTS